MKPPVKAIRELIRLLRPILVSPFVCLTGITVKALSPYPFLLPIHTLTSLLPRARYRYRARA